MRPRRGGFTLIELVVVTGLISTLVAAVMPAIMAARGMASRIKCASNLHQIEIAFGSYVAAFNAYPPNVTTQCWYDDNRIGAYLPALRPPVPKDKPGGGVYVCPEDTWNTVFLSYAMNVWASSTADLGVVTGFGKGGVLWGRTVKYPDRMILVAEAYSGIAVGTAGFAAPPTIGSCVSAATNAGTGTTTAGQRFGGAGGVPCAVGKFKKLLSELNFGRHRSPGLGTVTAPKGRLNILYADGHVESKTDADLVRPDGTATGDSCWSPADLGG